MPQVWLMIISYATQQNPDVQSCINLYSIFPVICMRESLRTGQIVHLGEVLIASPTLSGTMKNILQKNPHPQKIFIFSFHVVYGRMDVYGLSTGAAEMILCSMRSFQIQEHYDTWDEKFLGMWNLRSSLDNTVMIADYISLELQDEIQNLQGVWRNIKYWWKKDSAMLVKLFHIFGLGNPFLTLEEEFYSVEGMEKMENKCRICRPWLYSHEVASQKTDPTCYCVAESHSEVHSCW